MRLYSFGTSSRSSIAKQQSAIPRASASQAAWNGSPLQMDEDLYWGENNDHDKAVERGDKHYTEWTPADEERLRRAAQGFIAQRIASSQVLDPVKEAAVTKLSQEGMDEPRRCNSDVSLDE